MRIGFALALALSGAVCSQPYEPSPMVGEFAFEGSFTQHYHSTPCVRVGDVYCKETTGITEPVAGTVSVPDDRVKADSEVFEGVIITVGQTAFPYNGTARIENGEWSAKAQPQEYATFEGATLRGTMAGDSIVGFITVAYGTTPNSYGYRTGTMVARRK